MTLWQRRFHRWPKVKGEGLKHPEQDPCLAEMAKLDSRRNRVGFKRLFGLAGPDRRRSCFVTGVGMPQGTIDLPADAFRNSFFPSLPRLYECAKRRLYQVGCGSVF